jgi:hypothetical protein
MSQAIADQLFLAYMGRAADTQWRSNTATLVTAQNGNPSAALQEAFYTQAVAEGVFSTTDSNSVLVNKIFLQTFGFAASVFEQTAWGNLISNGTMSASSAAWTIFKSYMGATNVPDAYKLPAQSKLVAMAAFSNALTDPTINAAYSQINSEAATAGRTWLSGVTSQATAATSIAGVAATVAGLTAVAGQTIALSVDADELTGTSGDDTFRATVDTADTLSTLSSDDVIDGGDGTDTLTVFLNSAVSSITETPVVTNVEVLEVRASVAATLDLSGATLSGLETISIVRSRDTLALTLDDMSGASLSLDSVSDQAITITANDANDSTLTLSIIDSDTVALTIAEADEIDTLDLTITGNSDLTLTLGDDDTVTTVGITGTGDLELVFLGTALTSIDASELEGGLTFDGTAVTEGLTIVGGTGDDAVTGGSGENIFTGNDGDDTFNASATGDITFSGGAGDDSLDVFGATGDITFSGGTGDDTLDLSAGAPTGDEYDDSSFDGGDGTDTIIISAEALTSDVLVDATAFTDFEVLEINAGSATLTFDFADFTSVSELVFGSGVDAVDAEIDNADNKTVTLLAAEAILTINDDTTSDVVVLNIDSSDTEITAATITFVEIEDITVNIAAGGTSNAITLTSLAITGSETVEINITDASTSGAVVDVIMSVDSGDIVLNLDAESGAVAADFDGADSVTINMGADIATITAITTDSTDVAINMDGSTNVITAADLSDVETLVITSAGDGNSIAALTAASLVDLTLAITGGDFSLLSEADNILLETITITGDGEVTSVVVDAASVEFTLLDLSGFTGTIAASGIDLSALTVGIDIEIGEITGATAADTGGQILLAANTLRDTIVFNDDFDGFLMIEGFDGGANAADDLIDLSALDVVWADLDLVDDGTDTSITSDEFGFTIVLTGVVLDDVSQLNFVF